MASKRHAHPRHDGTSWVCPVCGKKSYSTWEFAAWDARQQRLKKSNRRRERPYFSRACGAFHVGAQSKRRRIE